MKSRKRFLPSQRLRKQDTFKGLVEKGNFARGRFFCAWAAPRRELDSEKTGRRPALGVVVNRKNRPLATARNALKRTVREIFRKRQGELKEGTAILIKAREDRPTPDFQAAEEDLMELFKKTGALT